MIIVNDKTVYMSPEDYAPAYEQYHRFMHSLSHKRFKGNEDEKEDLVSELKVLLLELVYNSEEEYTHEEVLSILIGRFEQIRYQNKLRRQMHVGGSILEAIEAVTFNFLDKVVLEEALKEVESRFDDLSIKIFRMRVFDGLKFKEIEKKTSITKGAIWKRYDAIRGFLREYLYDNK